VKNAGVGVGSSTSSSRSNSGGISTSPDVKVESFQLSNVALALAASSVVFEEAGDTEVEASTFIPILTKLAAPPQAAALQAPMPAAQQRQAPASRPDSEVSTAAAQEHHTLPEDAHRQASIPSSSVLV
jgi:hypothetical protein